MEIIGKGNVRKVILKLLFLRLIILEANLKEFRLAFIMLLLMIIIMSYIVGVEIVLDSLVKVPRI